MTLPKSDLTQQRLQILKDFDDDIIDQLLHSVSTYTDQKHKTLANQAEEIQAKPLQDGLDAEWLAALLDDDHAFLDEAHKLIYELAIVALYKKKSKSPQGGLWRLSFPVLPPNRLLSSKN